MSIYQFVSVEECELAGYHLKNCNKDGYCNGCGHQEVAAIPATERQLQADVSRNLAVGSSNMLTRAVDLLEPDEEFVGAGEYLRGMADLIAQCFPEPGVDSSTRLEQVRDEIVRRSQARK